MLVRPSVEVAVARDAVHLRRAHVGAVRAGNIDLVKAGTSTGPCRTCSRGCSACAAELGHLSYNDSSGFQVPLTFVAVLVALLVFVNIAPNTWEFRFKPTRMLAVATAFIAVAAILKLAAPSPFLYFQF